MPVPIFYPQKLTNMNKVYTYIVLFLCINMYYINGQTYAITSNIYRFNYNGHTYEVVKENKSWTAAASCAVDRGGYLAEISDAAENTAIFNALTSTSAGINISQTSTSNGGNAAYVWIGGNDIATERTWIWNGDNNGTSTQFWSGTKTGSTTNSAYTNWGTTGGTQNEPDNYDFNQDGLAIALNAWPTHITAGQGLGVAGQWNDIRDVETLYYLIEYDTVLSSAAPAQIEDSRVFVYEKQLFIEAANTPIAAVALYDLTGKKVFTTTTESTPKPIDVSQFVRGIYLAEIHALNGNTFVQRVKM